MTRSCHDDAHALHGVGVVVVAAGSGSRLGEDRPKAFVRLDDETILEHALVGALAAGADRVVLVVPSALVAEAEGYLDLHAGCGCGDPVVVAGGAERGDSVAAGLAALGDGIDVALVHDAARCLTPATVYERVVAAVRGGAAGAVPGLPVVDTIKVVDESGVVTQTPPRTSLRAVQTPQGFPLGLLRDAYATGRQATDDAALVELLGHVVVVVEGDPLAFKITDQEDLRRARALLASGLV